MCHDCEVSGYLGLLEHSFDVGKACGEFNNKLEFLSEHIFDFTTYDSEMASLLGGKALEVCTVINDKKTFDYIKDKDNYRWYLLMCNMPFFEGKLEWGTSIRGAWWSLYGDNVFELSSCGLYVEGEQLLDLKLNEKQWDSFVKAMKGFIE